MLKDYTLLIDVGPMLRDTLGRDMPLAIYDKLRRAAIAGKVPCLKIMGNWAFKTVDLPVLGAFLERANESNSGPRLGSKRGPKVTEGKTAI